MSEHRAPFHPQGVVVGDDGSANAAAAVRFAAQEARLRGATLHVVSAFSLLSANRPPDLPFGYVPSETELQESALATLTTRWAELEGDVELHAIHGTPTKVLVEASASADLVVVGARGMGGFEAMILGSVADQVMHHAECPVVLVKA